MARAPRSERSPQAHAELCRVPDARRHAAARRGVGVPPALRARRRRTDSSRAPSPNRSDLGSRMCSRRGPQPDARVPARRSVCSAGGCSRAVCSRRSAASPTPPARPRADRSRTGSSWKAADDEFRELADAFDAMLARLETQVAEQQRFAANASHELRTPLAITQTLLEVARKDPNRDTGELVERLHAVNARAIDLTEALLAAQPRRPALVHARTRRPVARRRRSDRDAAAAREEHGITIETAGERPTIGSTRSCCSCDEPRPQRDRPQPPRRGAV